MDPLGTGGSATVFRAEAEDGRNAAMKVLHPLRVLPEDVKRFTREYEAVSKMNHPNVVEVFEAGVHAGFPWIAMEYVEGRAPELSSADVIFLPPIADPAKILCVGLNYAKHQAETGRPDVDHPTIFTRFADSQVGHLQPMIKPDHS